MPGPGPFNDDAADEQIPDFDGTGDEAACHCRSATAKGNGVGEWRRLVAHLVWDQGVAGSNPVSPTIIR